MWTTSARHVHSFQDEKGKAAAVNKWNNSVSMHGKASMVAFQPKGSTLQPNK